MKSLLVALCLFVTTLASAQADKIFLHNGKTVEGSVVKVAEFTIVYKYLNEDAEQTISKYGVNKIVYGKSGRSEEITKKIVVSSKDDWESVVILEDKTAVSGLSKVGEIRGKTSMINYRTAAGGDKKAQEKLKKEAAEQGCPFILITSDKDAGMAGGTSRGFGGVQSMKSGIAYKY
jgi:sRNA-binding regulator protein Hfq